MVLQDFKKAFKETCSCVPKFTDSNGNTTASATTRYMAVSNVRGDKTETHIANNGEIREMCKKSDSDNSAI